MNEETRSAKNEFKDWQVALREDLVVRRHLFRKQAFYMVHDPVAFQNHRLTLQDYRIISALRSDRKVEDSFEQLVRDGDLKRSDEEGFYSFVSKLHRLGLLSLPFTDADRLYGNYQAVQKSKNEKSVTRYLFFRCALANPDAFLDRILPYFGWLFTPLFLAVWALAFVLALATLVIRIDDFVEPVNSLLSQTNVILMACAFLGLKVWHELGHGLACKKFGGRVPEMGTILIAGMPLAYMDASAAWNFSKRRHRLVVMFGGMFFESLIAIPALFIWAFSNNSFIGLFAFQLVFMAGFTTLLFNANPLMKYDGYFIFCELVGLPNLRQRSLFEIRALLKRVLLGIPNLSTANSLGLRLLFLTYGVSSVTYRTMVILGISAMLAGKYLMVGVGIGLLYLISTLRMITVESTRYLLFSKETEQVRTRARICFGAFVIGIPCLVCFFPVLGAVHVYGIVSAESEQKIRVATPGFVSKVFAHAGESVEQGEKLLTLSNLDSVGGLKIARADFQTAVLKQQAQPNTSSKLAKQLEFNVEQKKNVLLRAQQKFNDLTLSTPSKGRIAECVLPNSSGQFFSEGEVVATIVNGKTILKTWLTAEQMNLATPSEGDEVVCRFSNQTNKQFRGEITNVALASVRRIESEVVTTAGGGEILVDPIKLTTLEPMFELKIEVPDHAQEQLIHNARSSIQLSRRYEPIGVWISRKCMQFIHKLRVG